jgi:hypothetical protein
MMDKLKRIFEIKDELRDIEIERTKIRAALAIIDYALQSKFHNEEKTMSGGIIDAGLF